MKKKTSEIWCFFRAIDDTFALCNICKAKLSYKTTTTNLSKHMNRMHPNANGTASVPSRKYKYLPQLNERHRGKPRNSIQESIMVTFIRKHPILLQNLSWETRGSHESLWDQLASELNDSGPPLKDVATWKKALKDWKRFIIKKVAKNELHNIPLATGLSSAEETIASLCRLNDDVNQMIINASEDELQDTSNTAFDMDDVEDIVPEDIDHNAALQDTAGYTYEPDDCKEQADIDPLYVQSAKRSAQLESRSIHKELQAMSKKITTISEATDGTKNALSEFCALYKKKLTEDARHHAAMEQLLAEKNALKKQLLELEQRKLLK